MCGVEVSWTATARVVASRRRPGTSAGAPAFPRPSTRPSRCRASPTRHAGLLQPQELKQLGAPATVLPAGRKRRSSRGTTMYSASRAAPARRYPSPAGGLASVARCRATPARRRTSAPPTCSRYSTSHQALRVVSRSADDRRGECRLRAARHDVVHPVQATLPLQRRAEAELGLRPCPAPAAACRSRSACGAHRSARASRTHDHAPWRRRARGASGEHADRRGDGPRCEQPTRREVVDPEAAPQSCAQALRARRRTATRTSSRCRWRSRASDDP